MRIAVCGLGFMGVVHLKALKNIPGVQLAAVVDADARRLEGDLSGIQGNLGGPGEKFDFSGVARYTDASEALRDPGIDAVDFCLPTHLHRPLVLEALRAGKHVLVEKPMGLDGAECDEMSAEAARTGRVLMVAQVLRFLGMYQVLHERVKSGALGALRSALFRRRCAAPGWQRWVYDRKVSGGGVFDLLIHDVDQCLWLFGVPEEISAVGYEDLAGGIDHLTATLFYPGIGPVVVTGGWHHANSYPFSMEFTVVSDGGTLEYSSAGRPLTLYRADGGVEPLETPAKDGYQAELEYFLECCRKGARADYCPPEESALAVKLTQLLVEARAGNGRKLPCRL